MKLDRNINPDGRGKYALIKLRVDQPSQVFSNAPHIVGIKRDAIDYGDTYDTEFFVIRIKDKYAANALYAYAEAAEKDDPEFASEVLALANKAASHLGKKRPD